MQQRTHKVLHPNDHEIRLYSTEEFERVMQVKFQANLTFQNDKVLQKTQKLCLKASENEEFDRKQKWLGVLFAPEIEEGREVDALIQWIDPKMGYGVFATKDLPPFTFIGEYTGEVRKRKWADNRNYYCYDYAIGEKSPFLIDAEKSGNLTRFINHSRSPNLEPLSVLSGGLMHLILLTTRWVKSGEQLLYDYGPEYWKKRKDET